MSAILYLNTDLDLVAACDLTPLTAALEMRGVFALSVAQGEDGLWYARLELSADEGEPHEPERAITAMLAAVESLDLALREMWSQCRVREFNIGYECGKQPWAFNNGLTNGTLQRIAQAGASLRITIYPAS